MKDIKIVIAAHKKYRMPNDDIYLPVQVGAVGKPYIGYQRDDEGDNISELNPYFCELTALYWAWKNLDADYIGLAHYRRHFASLKKKSFFNENDPFDYVISGAEVNQLLNNVDIILPYKRHYYIESLYSHYSHTHYEEHLILTRKLISKSSPEYLYSFDKVMEQTSGHMFNMMIMSKGKFNDYCNWLFPILFRLEKEIDYKKYDSFQQRLFGRVSELLLNVWIEYNQYQYDSVPLLNVEGSNLKKRIPAFLKAKFFHKKYKGSF